MLLLSGFVGLSSMIWWAFRDLGLEEMDQATGK